MSDLHAAAARLASDAAQDVVAGAVLLKAGTDVHELQNWFAPQHRFGFELPWQQSHELGLRGLLWFVPQDRVGFEPSWQQSPERGLKGLFANASQCLKDLRDCTLGPPHEQLVSERFKLSANAILDRVSHIVSHLGIDGLGWPELVEFSDLVELLPDDRIRAQALQALMRACSTQVAEVQQQADASAFDAGQWASAASRLQTVASKVASLPDQDAAGRLVKSHGEQLFSLLSSGQLGFFRLERSDLEILFNAVGQATIVENGTGKLAQALLREWEAQVAHLQSCIETGRQDVAEVLLNALVQLREVSGALSHLGAPQQSDIAQRLHTALYERLQPALESLVTREVLDSLSWECLAQLCGSHIKVFGSKRAVVEAAMLRCYFNKINLKAPEELKKLEAALREGKPVSEFLTPDQVRKLDRFIDRNELHVDFHANVQTLPQP